MSHARTKKLSLAVLMTCFNRRDQTLRCLDAVFGQANQESFATTVILVDDGSSDGTAKAVRTRFPDVCLIEGSGNLYWNRGMRLAFEHALSKGFDAYLWLNDDTVLFHDAISRLLDAAREIEKTGEVAIVTGSTWDVVRGEASYGGFCWNRGWRRQLLLVEPYAEAPALCDTMNGNCTLIPKRIAVAIGNLDPAFHHSFGDMDYGFRARAAGFAVYVAPGFFGSCTDNSRAGTWRDRTASFGTRWRHLRSPKGSPFGEWSLYCRRHLGVLWPLYAISPYLKTLATPIRRPGQEAQAQ